jgi:hypothetical protein
MTLRQQIRIRFLIFKKALQLRGPLTETELNEVLAGALDEAKILFQSIGALSVAWAQLETFLDYFNGVLIMHRNHPELELPKSLKPKIGFFKRSFDRIPELAPFRERTAKIVSELNRLKTVRHDAVHGVALERMPVGTHKAIRLDTKGKDISQQHATYKLADIAFAANDTLALLRELSSLHRDVFCALYPDQAKLVFSSTSPPTTPTAAPPAATSLSRAGENGRATHQGHRLRAHLIHFSINAIAGLLIGGASGSWFDVLVSSMGWGIVTGLFVALIASGWSYEPGTKLFFGSPILTRFIVWWSISLVTSLIVGSLTYAVRAVLV